MGMRCCYVNRSKPHAITERCYELAEQLEQQGTSSALFVVVLRESICADDFRMVPMLTYLEHLRSGWAFTTRPFRSRTLRKECKVVVFGTKAPEDKYVSDHWTFWVKKHQ